ncbi:trypsin-like serine protease, partial [Streptomyces sp. NPDC007325]|uniref:trypsin-like serine protease n=1 Tax=Streptomyces sp. NPDC007325 TaxID=3154588 RepID=UPI003402F124
MHTRATRMGVTVMTVAALTIPAAGQAFAAQAAPADATEAVMPYAFEDGAYPNADRIEADKGIKLIRGDGNITLADCDLDATQIRVQVVGAPANKQEMYCFVSRADTGLLTLDLNRAFWIDAADQPMSATLTAEDGTDKTITIPKGGYAPVGEGVAGGTRSRLVEIRVTGPSGTAPALSGDTTYGYTGRLRVGDFRSCTATLVARNWAVTAKSCFADDPAVDNNVAQGAPKLRSTLLLGRSDLSSSGLHSSGISEVVPHPDRDLVMARLDTPADTVTPVALGTTAPVAGEKLTVAGFGRTSTAWTPNVLHAAEFTVGATVADGFDLAASASAGATVCKGDAGAPALRVVNGNATLVGIGSRSQQAGCLGNAGTAVGAHGVRTDNVSDWVRSIITRDRTTPADIDGDGKDDLVVQRTDGTVTVHRNLGTSFGAGTVMSSGWRRYLDGTDLGRLYFADITGDNKADLVVHGTDGNISVRKNMGTYFDGGTHWT